MKIFLTGATGFVGGSLARALIGRGHTLTALFQPSSNRQRLAGLPINWVEGDVTRPETLTGLLDGQERVIHAAGRLGAFGISQEAYIDLHVGGTRNLLGEAVKAGAGRILYVSSPGVLGPSSDRPQEETAPYRPTNRYERSKALAEREALSFYEKGAPNSRSGA